MNNLDIVLSPDSRRSLKAVAIYSVITAHTTFYTCTYSFCPQLSRFLIAFGFFGVGVFFALLGLDYPLRKKRSILEMLRLDILHYIIPWFFSGLTIYSSLLLRKGGADLTFFDFLFGNGSYLWFIPIFLLFRYFLALPFSGVLFLVLLPVSLFVYSSSDPYDLFGLNSHLNFLYWLPYVCVGRFAPWLFNWIYSLKNIWRESAVGLSLIATPFVINLCFPSSSLTYFSYSVLFFSLLFFYGILVLFSTCSSLPWLQSVFSTKFFKFLSGQTLFIYLWHMLIVGALSRLLGHNLFVLLVPVAVLLILYFVFLLIRFYYFPVMILLMGIKPES